MAASFYYDRNSYNVVYISGGKTVNTASYKYQQSIADAGNYKLTTPPVGMEKYIFAGWCADPFGLPEYVFDGKTMPAQNITVYAYWAAPTVYGFAHITMEGADGKELTIPYGGTIDESMLPRSAEAGGRGLDICWLGDEERRYLHALPLQHQNLREYRALPLLYQ